MKVRELVNIIDKSNKPIIKVNGVKYDEESMGDLKVFNLHTDMHTNIYVTSSFNTEERYDIVFIYHISTGL